MTDLKTDLEEGAAGAKASAAPPLTVSKMKKIVMDACDATLAPVAGYDHASTESWNSQIIKTVLSRLVEESQAHPEKLKHKFIVNSTIMQHSLVSNEPSSSLENGNTGGGRRGMHSATGAYWNEEKDGMFNYKYEAGSGKGLDVVCLIVWIAV